MVLAHRKELLEQNLDKIKQLDLLIPTGIYSASFNRRQTDEQIIMAQIQSVHDKAFSFGQRNLLIIDEAHLVSPSEGTMYDQFFSDMKISNPNMRAVGLTATPYRMKEGSLVGGERSLWTSIAYTASIPKLIAQGYLAELCSDRSVTEVHTEDLHVRNGEFVTREQEDLFISSSVLRSAVNESILKMVCRKSILVFCVSLVHAERTAEELRRRTREEVGIVTGNTSPLERDAYLRRFRNREIRWLVNCDVLTTGFDAPNIDGIVVLRATQSPGLFAQICGRGFRTYAGKKNCLVLDFGGNIDRHGPIDSPMYGKVERRKRTGGNIGGTNETLGEGEGPQIRTKACPACRREEILVSTSLCPDCGFKFPYQANHEGSASSASVLQKPERWIVQSCAMIRHKPKDPGKLETLRVTYECYPENSTGGNLEAKFFSEWVCIEHEGFARTKAEEWFAQRSREICPDSIDDVVAMNSRGELRVPRAIETVRDGKYFYRLKPIAWDDWNEMELLDVVDSREEVDPWEIDDDDIPF